MKTVRSIRGLALTGVAALGLIAMTPAMAESDFDTGNNPSASARLDFEVIIPRFISFRVGSAGSTVDTVTFNVAGTDVGNGNAVAGSNAVAVTLLGNVGNIDLVGTTTGPLDNGSGGTLSWTQITSNSSDAGLAAPDLVDGAASATVVVTPNVGTSVVNRTANWSFLYENDNIVGAGTYEGQVVYTASMP